MLTEEQRTKYLESPQACPYCGSEDLTLGNVTADVHRATQSISCRKCKKRWANIYALTRMEEDEWDMKKEEIRPKTEERS